MTQIRWITSAGSLGTIPEGRFYRLPLQAVAPGEDVKFKLISGRLPAGIQVKINGTLEGIPEAVAITQGVPLPVDRNVTSKFTVRAYVTDAHGTVIGIADRTFEVTVTGQDAPRFVTPSGSLGGFLDATEVRIPIQVADDDNEELTITVASGQLPPGLTVVGNVIQGIIEPELTLENTAIPGFDRSSYDQYPFDFSAIAVDRNYQFTLEVTDGKETDRRQYSIFVMARNNIPLDPSERFALLSGLVSNSDSDWTVERPPFITNALNELTVRHDNYFFLKFNTVDFDGDQVGVRVVGGVVPPFLYNFKDTNTTFDNGTTTFKERLEAYKTVTFDNKTTVFDSGRTQMFVSGHITFDTTTPNLTSNATTFDCRLSSGETSATRFYSYLPVNVATSFVNNSLFGQLPDQGATEEEYVFVVEAYKLNNPAIRSRPYQFKITVVGDIEKEVTWLTATVDSVWTGQPSTSFVQAASKLGYPLQYRLAKNTASKLPQGLQLLPTGEIAGRPSINQLMFDGEKTTFDSELATRREVKPTTFDRTFEFVVEAFYVDPADATNTIVSTFKQFTIQVRDSAKRPWEGLYIQAMPPLDDRAIVREFLSSTIFDPEMLFRPNDPNFGLARNIVYHHAFGVTAADLEQYVDAVQQSHYSKEVTIGELKSAQALDDNGQVEYEVIYASIVDDLVTASGESISTRVQLPPLKNRPVDASGVPVSGVYPNSLQNMQKRIFTEVGRVIPSLPAWMRSKQPDGRVLGFTPAWVIAYTKPGKSRELLYRIQENFINVFNKIDFSVDRFIVDKELTYIWGATRTPSYAASLAGAGVTVLPGAWDTPTYTTFDIDVNRTFDPVNTYDRGTVTTETLADPPFWISGAVSTIISNSCGQWDCGEVLGLSGGTGTTFDRARLRFVAPVISYGQGDIHNKYVMFTKRGIFK